jgi:vacuolar-type H+-ATPase subunit I/STV1
MPGPESNHIKTLYQSFPNLLFIALMLLLSLVISPAFLFLLLAGELGLLMIAQTKSVNRLLRARAERERKQEQERIENQVVAGLGDSYKSDFQTIKQLCQDIEHHALEVEKDRSSKPLVEGVVDKLSSFRFEYLRMLRAHFLLANRNYKQMRQWLDGESRRVEKAIATEASEQVRATLQQNLKVLRQRAARVEQLDELVRVIEARLQVVRNSLQLIQDEVYSITDVHSINSIVDELLINLEVNDEFRAYYNDALSDESPLLAGLDAIEKMEAQADPLRSSAPRQMDGTSNQ